MDSKIPYDCDICCETFNKSTHKRIICACGLHVCKQCVKTYLLGDDTADAHCMKCKKQWDRAFCQKAINQSFYNGEYRKHRKDVLFEIEQSDDRGEWTRYKEAGWTDCPLFMSNSDLL